MRQNDRISCQSDFVGWKPYASICHLGWANGLETDMATRYPIGDSIKQCATLLGVSPERVLRRVGLSASLSDDDDIQVGPEKFFQVWDAIVAEANQPRAEMELAMAYAHGPFIPPVFAFSCADTLALGVERLCDFKPLIGPMNMVASRPNQQLYIELHPSNPDLKMPASMGLFELLYITECARTFTGTDTTPVATSLPAPIALDETTLEFLGKQPEVTQTLSLTFSAEDADLPLITRSKSLWESLEPGLLEQMETRMGTGTMAAKIKRTLTEVLPGGSTNIEDMAKRLNVSKRSLQRRLGEEGTNFQELLNETRYDMSHRYLKDSGLSVPEISYLLGFRDTSSFFRAFHGWTGMTPGDYRSSDVEAHAQRLN
jgi:AraC-like DNA-binding protein